MKLKNEKNEIHHEYFYRKKKKVITTISGLKQYCTVNKYDFVDLLSTKFNYTFWFDSYQISSRRCKTCNALLEVQKVDPSNRKIFFKSHGCIVNGCPRITLDRTKTVLDDEDAERYYEQYCKKKTKKWKPNNPDTTSLKSHIERHGEEFGTKMYQEKIKKIDTISIEYFKKKGYSTEAAKVKQSERQQTFTLEKCIQRLGEDEGRKRWQERQDKWQKTLNDKPIEEIERINNSKLWKSGNVSKQSISLFESIDHQDSRWSCRGGEKLLKVEINGVVKNKMVDFLYQDKIIEYFGTYWHADPRFFPDKDTIIRGRRQNTVRSINLDDETYLNGLRNLGYKVMVVWEYDFTHHVDDTIKKCKEFLYDD